MLSQGHDTNKDTYLSFHEGHEQAFNHFFGLYYKPLLHFANAIVRDKEIAEDIVEDSFMKLWEKRERMASESAIKPFLYAIVRNACIDILRKKKHENDYKKHVQKLPPALAEDMTRKMVTAEAMNHVFLALQKLPPKYKQIFQMIWIEGKEIKDISKELNLPLSTVKSQKARTLELIRKQLPQLGISMLLFIYKLL